MSLEPFVTLLRLSGMRTRLVLASLLLLAACGTTDNPTTTADSTDLRVSYVSQPDSLPVEWTLTCDPADGSHPDPEGACAALEAADAQPFAPVPSDAMCTAIFGGPQTATVTGVWAGRQVDASFSRTNGCEIDRWERLVPLLPNPSPSG